MTYPNMILNQLNHDLNNLDINTTMALMIYRRKSKLDNVFVITFL